MKEFLFTLYFRSGLISEFKNKVLERGPNSMQGAVLSILHCLLHYVDFNLSANAQQVNSDLLRVIAKYIEV